MSRDRLKLAREVMELPLPQLFGKLCQALPDAQEALDANAIAMLQRLASTTVEVPGGEPRSLIALGFVPSFYQITEATVHAKLTFSLQKSESVEVGGSAGVNVQMFSAAFNASYSSKFSFSASGTSEVTARIASVPPPMALLEAVKTPTR